MSKVWILIALLVIVGAGAYFMMMGNNQTTAPAETTPETNMEQLAPKGDSMRQTVSLSEQNESSESGTAVLVEEGGKVRVTLNMVGAPADEPQPAHIHVGSCPDVGAIAYPLTNVVNGKSETMLDVTFAQLAAKQPLGINVHKSVPQTKVYVSCGDVFLPSGASSTTTQPAPATAPAPPAPVPPSNPRY